MRRTVFTVLLVIGLMFPATGLASQWQFLSPEQAPDPKTLPGAKVIATEHRHLPGEGSLRPASEPGVQAWWRGNFCYVFDRYDDTRTVTNWEGRLRGTVRWDNIHSSQPVTLRYQQQQGGSDRLSVQAAFSVDAGLQNVLIGTATVRTGLEATYEHAWSSSTQVEAEMVVPPGIVGYIYSYLAKVNTRGNVLFRVYYLCHPNEFAGYERFPVSAGVPTNGYYNYKSVTARR